MKKPFHIFLVLAMLTAIILYQAVTIKAHEAGSLEVAESVICWGIEHQEPQSHFHYDLTRKSFEVSVTKLYCFTKITGAKEAIEITHVWYYGDVEKARAKLSVETSSWSTWSQNIIQPHDTGDWHVDVIGPDGEVLETLEFQTN